MLETSVALVFSEDEVWLEKVRGLCQSLGLARSYPYVGVEDLARRGKAWPIQFIIVSALVPREKLVAELAAIRRHRDLEVKFTPVIVLSKDPAPASILPFILMGCDDLVSFPCSRATFASRLAMQIGRPLDYYETEQYFGPDRRRLDRADADHAGRGQGGQVTHYVIQRDPQLGTRVLAREESGPRRPARTA